MRIRIIIAYVARYRSGHRLQFVPPVTGIHLAALAGEQHEVEVVHEQARSVPVDDSPDLVLLSFFSGFARRAYAIADAYRALGVRVVCGGPHASYWVEEALEHADAVVVGEAESVWQKLLGDAERGTLARVYKGEPVSLEGLPTPRYDLLESSFIVRRVLQATRGCPFHCSFCSVPDFNPGFRTRPVAEVVRDIEAVRFPHFFQEKLVWFWDDNLLVQRRWAKQLLSAMVGLDRWWLTQASIDIVKDRELLDLMRRSGCIGIFLGIESLDADALQSVDKRQNQVRAYREAVQRLHEHGICVMAGFISGFDTQTRESIVSVAERLNELEFDVPFLSVLTPFRGTPLYDELLANDRILKDRDWPYYNGYNVAFRPARLSPQELHAAHRELWQRAFSPSFVAQRVLRGAHQLRAGALMLSAAMNGFYGHKALLGNLPADAQPGAGSITHAPKAEPLLNLRSLRQVATP
ncbi:MAG: radical SAM protein [Polyangiaceae bacterium]